MVSSCIWESPRAQRSPSPLFSHPLHFLFSPSILSLIQTKSSPPLLPFPLMSGCLTLGVSQFLTRSLPLSLPGVLYLPLCSTFLLSFSSSLPSFIFRLSSSFILWSEVSKRQKGYVERPDHCWRGTLAQPLLLTPGPWARFIFLRRHKLFRFSPGNLTCHVGESLNNTFHCSLTFCLPSLSPSLFLSLSLPKRCRHLQVFNEEIAPIKGAALAVKREHEEQTGR